MYNPYIMLNDGSAIHKDEIRRIKIKGFDVVGITEDDEHEIRKTNSDYEAIRYLQNLVTYGSVNESQVEAFDNEALVSAVDCVMHVMSTNKYKKVSISQLENIYEEEFSPVMIESAVDVYNR